MTTETQRGAFISYSRINKEFASKLSKGLRLAGYSIWFDLFDIPTGSRWDDEVEKALRKCSIFMIILTPASIASENVKDEIGYAIDHGKRILPILLEHCDVPLRLRRFQYVDFTTKSFEEGFESAKELLGDLVDEASAPVAVKPPVVEEQTDQRSESEKKVEAERIAQAAAETERKAKEKAVRLAKQKAEREAKAEAERLAQVAAETERKAKEESDRLVAQESERKAKVEAERLAQVTAETERKAKEESDRLAAQKSEREAKAKAKPIQAAPDVVKVEVVSTASAQKRPISNGFIGVAAVVALMLIIAGIGFGAFSKSGSGNSSAADPATKTPVATKPATKMPVATSTRVRVATSTHISVALPTRVGVATSTRISVAFPTRGVRIALSTRTKVATLDPTRTPSAAQKLYESTETFRSLARKKYSLTQYLDMGKSGTPINIENPTLEPLAYIGADCALTQTLLESNSKNYSHIFEFNGKKIFDTLLSKNIHYYYDSYNDGTRDWFCLNAFVIIGNWERGRTYSFKYSFNVIHPYNDGLNDYSAGVLYSREFIVSIP